MAVVLGTQMLMPPQLRLLLEGSSRFWFLLPSWTDLIAYIYVHVWHALYPSASEWPSQRRHALSAQVQAASPHQRDIGALVAARRHALSAAPARTRPGSTAQAPGPSRRSGMSPP